MMCRKTVDLPLPLPPMTTQTVPRCTVKLTSSSTTLLPKRFRRCRTSIIHSGTGACLVSAAMVSPRPLYQQRRENTIRHDDQHDRSHYRPHGRMPDPFWAALDNEGAVATHHGDNDRKHHTFEQTGEHITKQQPSQCSINIRCRTEMID